MALPGPGTRWSPTLNVKFSSELSWQQRHKGTRIACGCPTQGPVAGAPFSELHLKAARWLPGQGRCLGVVFVSLSLFRHPSAPEILHTPQGFLRGSASPFLLQEPRVPVGPRSQQPAPRKVPGL